ncbi:hypothetical protein J2W40_000554 [Sphingobium xenophagum]|uniref:Uncharacterized protein n=1 Tax=Sphingobium xenophagum TaxID=121428 RepID=A0ABU1WXN8_SPHXE|nr:hypothetical protein [Sphingobium xenophagum]MDR7153757.1 hypothetical protein [Sphingobium xenophagum]
MQPPETDPPSPLDAAHDEIETAPASFDIREMESRLAKLEQMMADSLGRLDQLQHLVELSFMEAYAQRRENVTPREGKTRWSEAGFPIIPRNMPIFFGTLHSNDAVDVDDMLIRGWYAREDWGVWGRESVQQVRFAMEDYRGGYATVHLALQCFLPPEIVQQNVDILANGYFLGNFDLRGEKQIVSLRLPASCVGDGNILLQIQHESPVSPASAGVSSDTRILGVGLVSLDAG